MAALAEAAIQNRRDDPVSSLVDADQLAKKIADFDFSEPLEAEAAASRLLQLLRATGVRSDHPRYFGLFNPPALVAGIAGDIIAGTVNPQLAVWSHAPAAAEIERHLLDLFGQRIWDLDECAGIFTSGGSEANHTALLCALARRYPDWARHGVGALPKRPAIYASAESHLAWIKIARAAGLGSDAVRLVETGPGLSLDGDALARAITEDEECDPVLVVATAGTTAHGGVDDIAGLAHVARAHNCHFHVDAAWAGGALLSDEYRNVLSGIEQADSVTIDPHKWLAVPMGAGMYLARDWSSMEAAFAVSTGYMPSASLEHRDPYIHSLQWSRRFNGAKLFMTLTTLGWSGYAAIIDRQFALGERLRRGLAAAGFRILNRTALPLVCFVPERGGAAAVERIREMVTSSGEAWISVVKLRGEDALRACVTSFETDARDVDALIDLLVRVRAEIEA